MEGQRNAQLNLVNEGLCNAVPSESAVIVTLAIEREQVSCRLEKICKVIETNPKTLSARQKDLCHMQAKAMQEYIDVLDLRIKDLIDSDTLHFAEN